MSAPAASPKKGRSRTGTPPVPTCSVASLNAAGQPASGNAANSSGQRGEKVGKQWLVDTGVDQLAAQALVPLKRRDTSGFKPDFGLMLPELTELATVPTKRPSCPQANVMVSVKVQESNGTAYQKLEYEINDLGKFVFCDNVGAVLLYDLDALTGAQVEHYRELAANVGVLFIPMSHVMTRAELVDLVAAAVARVRRVEELHPVNDVSSEKLMAHKQAEYVALLRRHS